MNEGVRTCETVMLLVVSVPVLSEQMTSAHPRASTVGSLRTTALRLAIRITPKARVTVTTIGRPWKKVVKVRQCRKEVVPSGQKGKQSWGNELDHCKFPVRFGNLNLATLPTNLRDGGHGEADTDVEHV